MHIKPFSILLSALIAFFSLLSYGQDPNSQPDALMLRFPDISQDKIVFVYAENLWLVDKKGGVARQISNAIGQESFPKFSPDGKIIAFSGNYDGNNDVYSIPSEGGIPKRITFHPSPDYLRDWHPNGNQIMFGSNRESPSGRFKQFYLVDKEGGMPEKMPFFYIEWASFSTDGKKLAYQYLDRTRRNWKRYQGGTASDLWIHDFASQESQKITKYAGSDALPMWNADKVYFISDRGPAAKMNLWSYNTAKKSFRQETKFTEYDVKFPSLGPSEIVFENGGSLQTFDLNTGQIKEISISVPTDLMAVRPAYKNLSKKIQWFELSPTGKRAVFEARGEIVSVPAKHGPTINMTRTSGVAERSPKWSPDGKSLAYFSDQTGEYELYVRPVDGSEKAKQITRESQTYYYSALWSPDSKKLAYSDKSGNILIVVVSSGQVTKVFRKTRSPYVSMNWSPDSRYLVFAKARNKANNHIVCWDEKSKKLLELTSGFYNDDNPVFSKDGKFLFYTSNRHFSPIYSDMDWAFIYPNSTRIMAVALAKDDDPILSPRNDREKADEEDEDSKSSEKGKKGNKDEEKKEDEKIKVQLDVIGFEARGEVLPVDPGNIGGLAAADGKLIFTEHPLAGTGKPGAPGGTLKYYDQKERKAETIISGINSFDISADGKKLIYSSKGSYGIIEPAKGKKVGDGKLNLSGMSTEIDPREEWAQIFTEAWRIQRDFFYDEGMHQVDWNAMKIRYEKMLPFCTSRQDLNYIIGELFAELNVGHAYNYGGDIVYPKTIGVGLLGIDFEYDAAAKAYKIARIYRGAEWDPNMVSPLAAPHLKVEEGQYILAVNGIPLNGGKDPWAAFQGLNKQTVSLKISKSGSGSNARDVLVKTLSSENRLRNQSWVEANRKKVFDATGGKIGYIYVPNTGRNGQNELMRMFQGQFRMEGLIIDERFNSGGQVPDRFIELLNRPVLNYWGRRDRESSPTPYVVNQGPKVMLANEWAGSGGDAFPYYFKKAKVGPLVGKRTWGGLVGYSGGWPGLIDGGGVTSPNFGFFNTEGKWDVEGYGVDPDYEIENPSDKVFMGEDPQLEKAIEIILTELENYPKMPEKPAGPDRKGIGKGE
jgi:tricorn protease